MSINRREVLKSLGAATASGALVGCKPEDLIELHRRFYREFYFRPITIKRHLSGIKTWRDVYKYAQAASLFSFLFFNQDRPSIKMFRKAVVDKLKGQGTAKAAK